MASEDDEVPRESDNWFVAHHEAASAAVGSAVGQIAGGPSGGIVGAIVPPYVLAMMDGFGDRWRARRRENMGRVLLAAADEMGSSPDEVLRAAEASPQADLAIGQALAAGANTEYDAKIEALGRVLGRALLADDDALLDQNAVLIGILAEIEAPHIKLLDALTEHNWFVAEGPWERVRLYMSEHSWRELERGFCEVWR
ncbi:hypothetical protein GCM10027053_44770 [Intrasporangium mesophilum]